MDLWRTGSSSTVKTFGSSNTEAIKGCSSDSACLCRSSNWRFSWKYLISPAICAPFRFKRLYIGVTSTHWSNLQPPPADWNRAKNGYFSKDELRAFKSYWRANYGPRSKQLAFDDNWPILNR